MKNVVPYLFFDGQCRQAIDFYEDVLDGEIAFVQTFAEAPVETPEDAKDRIMHVQLVADDIELMASDTMPGQPFNPGSQVQLSLTFDDVDEQARVFHELAEGGKVTMALQDTFWGSRFGMITDKFGIEWMLNCSKR